MCRKVNDEGTITNRKRSGGPWKPTAKDDAFIALQAKLNPMKSSREISETLATSTALVSPATVRRRFRETCLRPHVVRAKPMIPRSAAKKRLAFPTKFVSMPLWQKVVFCDKSKFEDIVTERRDARQGALFREQRQQRSRRQPATTTISRARISDARGVSFPGVSFVCPSARVQVKVHLPELSPSPGLTQAVTRWRTSPSSQYPFWKCMRNKAKHSQHVMV